MTSPTDQRLKNIRARLREAEKEKRKYRDTLYRVEEAASEVVKVKRLRDLWPAIARLRKILATRDKASAGIRWRVERDPEGNPMRMFWS